MFLQNATPSKRALARQAADSPPLTLKKRKQVLMDDYVSSVCYLCAHSDDMFPFVQVHVWIKDLVEEKKEKGKGKIKASNRSYFIFFLNFSFPSQIPS